MDAADTKGAMAEGGGTAPPEPPRDPAAMLPAPPKAPGPDAKELDALLGALNKSAERLQSLWFTFLTATLYFAIAAGTTTHRMLLLEEGINLPILNVKLPLLPFYVIAPGFFLVLHFYMLMMLVLLARTASVFDAGLQATLHGEEQERYRMRIENTLFLQPLVGAWPERNGVKAWLLGSVATISLIIAPVLLLLMMQLMFLPYHNWITWWHRLALLLDLVFAWTLWPAYRWQGGAKLLPRWRRWHAVNVPLTAFAILFAFCLATYPRESLDGNVVSRMVDRWGEKIAKRNILATTLYYAPEEVRSDWRANGRDVGVKPSAILFGWDEKHSGAGKWLIDLRRGWFPNRLWLPNEVLVDAEKLKIAEAQSTDRHDSKDCKDPKDSSTCKAITGGNNNGDTKFGMHFSPTITLSNRDLVGANFSGATLRHADFLKARLAFANFDFAWLHDTRFNNAVGESASFFGAILENASLDFVNLQYTVFDRANLQGATLESAWLPGVSFHRVNLRGAYFKKATLRGAGLANAQLERAWFEEAELEGTLLSGAQLHGANLKNANLQGANLARSRIPKWWWWREDSDYSSEWYDKTDRQGIWFKGVQLQGALLEGVKLAGALLDGARVGGTWGIPGDLKPNQFAKLDFDRPAAEESVETWVAAFIDTLPVGSPVRDKLKDQRSSLRQDTAPDLKFDEGWWDEQKNAQKDKWPHKPMLREAFNKLLSSLACDEVGAPWVVRHILTSETDNPFLADLSGGDIRKLAVRLRRAAGKADSARHADFDGEEMQWRVASRKKEALAHSNSDQSCPGGHGLADDDLKTLDKLAADAEEREREEARGAAFSARLP